MRLSELRFASELSRYLIKFHSSIWECVFVYICAYVKLVYLTIKTIKLKNIYINIQLAGAFIHSLWYTLYAYVLFFYYILSREKKAAI